MKHVKPFSLAIIALCAVVVSASSSYAQAPASKAPRKSAVSTGSAARIAQARPVQGVVNLNTAAVADLVLLPKVGDAVAQRIVEYRDRNGAFKKVEEVLNVRGIGEKSLEILRPYLTLTGSTTIKVAASSE